MGRYYQSLARIGLGLAAMAMLAWLLWPDDLSRILQPEPLAMFCIGLVCWVFAEFKHPEDMRASGHTGYDLQVASRLVKAHRTFLRTLLKDEPLWTFIEIELYHEMWALLAAWERGELFFSSNSLQRRLDDFFLSLKQLSSKVAQDTVPESIGGGMVIGYKPYRIVTQEEYDRRMKESKKADLLANTAWTHLDDLINELRHQIPDAFLDS